MSKTFDVQSKNEADNHHSAPFNKKEFFVSIIEKKETYPWLLRKHYARTIPNIMFAFGLYKNHILKGVCCFGTPANNHNNQIGKYKMIELVRLCVDEGLPKNCLSFFVSKCLGCLKKPLAIISYADKGKNHNGYIYQATNWIYTGVGGGVDFYIDKEQNEIHSRIMSDYRLKMPNLSRREIAKKLEWRLEKGTFKHRYFYFLGDKNQIQEMKYELFEKYKQHPYPKGENKRYDSGKEIETQISLF